MVPAAAVAALVAGCAVSHKKVLNPSQLPAPLQTATKEELIARLNRQAEAITSLNAAVTMKLTAGSAYTGVIEQYHEVNGFILAAKPAYIRVIGQAPVVSKDIFDMVSNGVTFRIFIPPKNIFIVGPASLERPAKKPIENLRPQHLIDALFWPPIPDRAPILFEEASEPRSRYYILTVVRPAGEGRVADASAVSSANWEIARKVWFDRADLNVARVETYGPSGRVSSDARYGDWEAAGTTTYSRQITLTRPNDDYELEIGIKKLVVNEPLAADRFVLQQPPGTKLVRAGEDAKEPQP
jgi:hypothetical protein